MTSTPPSGTNVGARLRHRLLAGTSANDYQGRRLLRSINERINDEQGLGLRHPGGLLCTLVESDQRLPSTNVYTTYLPRPAPIIFMRSGNDRWQASLGSTIPYKANPCILSIV
jgi:hypothetical protein